MNNLIALLVFWSWLAGIALAAGWCKLVSIFFPPYAFYLTVEQSLIVMGWK